MRKKIKFGIIGCSRVAARRIIPAIKSSKHADLATIGSRNPEKAEEHSKKFRCKNFGTYEDVLKSDVDAVYISLPSSLHEIWVILAAKNGKHIICEKSATTSLKSAENMVNTCRKNKVRLMEGFSFKFHPQHTKVKEAIKKKVLGNLYTFYGKFFLPIPKSNDIRLNKNLGGGVLNDAGCYPIYASRMFFEEEPIEAIGNLIFDKKHKVDIRANAILKYTNGKIGLVSASYDVEYQSMYELSGSKAVISTGRAYSVPKDYSPNILIKSKDKIKSIKIEPTNQSILMIDYFCRVLKNKGDGFGLEEDLVKQAKVMEAIRISSKKNKCIKI